MTDRNHKTASKVVTHTASRGRGQGAEARRGRGAVHRESRGTGRAARGRAWKKVAVLLSLLAAVVSLTVLLSQQAGTTSTSVEQDGQTDDDAGKKMSGDFSSLLCGVADLLQELRDESKGSSEREHAMLMSTSLLRVNGNIEDDEYTTEDATDARGERVKASSSSFVGDSTELELLRRNNVSLLEALHEEQRVRSMAQDDLEAMRLGRQADSEGHRVVVARLQSQVRSLCEESGMIDLYNLFEADTRRLSRELQALRERNLRLELQSLAVSEAVVIENNEGEDSDITKSKVKASTQLRSPLRQARQRDALLKQKAAELENLWKENEALRSQERGRIFSLQQSRDVARRLHLAAQTSQRLKQGWETEERDHGMTKGLLVLVQGEANALEEECRQLRQANEKLKAEYATMQAQVADGQAKMRRAFKAAVFVEKHKGGFRT